MPSPIFTLASNVVDQIAALDPFTATAMGVPGHEHEVTDYAPDAQARRADAARAALRRLDELPAEARDDEVARAVMQDVLGAAVEAHDAGDQYYSLRNIAGPVQELHEVFDLMARDSADDWRAIIDRLTALPRAAASVQALFEEGMRSHRVSSRRQAEEVIHQLSSFAGLTADTPPAFAGLDSELEESGIATPALKGELERAIGSAREAFAELRTFVADRYLGGSRAEDAAGEERYARAARGFLGMRLDLRETYAWGWEEVRRLQGEIDRTVERILPGGSLAQASAALDADPARTIEGEQNLIAWLQEFQDVTVRELNGRHFDLPEPVQRIEACIAPPGGALAQYYTPPSEDFSRPGRTWYPTGGHTNFNRWRDVTTAYHEGVPGHHLQCAIAVYEAEHLSRFQRLAAWYSGHGEGWALYAERLMAELGYLDDPGDYLGMLLGQMHRAVRVVVDLGAHLGFPIPLDSAFEPGQPWTYERMLAFLMEKASMPEDMARSEVLRYLGWPAQAISYKVGERAWLAIREESRTRRGEAFSLKAFHAAALPLGSVGLDLLRDLMREAY